MKLCFLDFDGVLVNRKSWYVRSGSHATGDPPCVAALNHITDTTGAQIVVSSSWRIGTPITELRSILKFWGVTAPVIDKTPRLIEDHGSIAVSQSRGAEIQRWLDIGWREIDAFVILDDDSDMEGLARFLVKTEFEVGLTMADAEAAIAILCPVAGAV